MNMLMENYLRLFSVGETEEAERYVSEYLHGKTMEEKANFFAKVVAGKLDGMAIDPKYKEIYDYEFKHSPWSSRMTWEEVTAEKRNHLGKLANPGSVCLLDIAGTLFVAGNCFLFHRGGGGGDAHVVQLWRNNERIFTAGGLVEAHFMHMYYDAMEDLLYLIYASDKENRVNGEFESTGYWSVAVIQDPKGEAVAKSFPMLLEE